MSLCLPGPLLGARNTLEDLGDPAKEIKGLRLCLSIPVISGIHYMCIAYLTWFCAVAQTEMPAELA